jgi:hypothetical protein
MEDALLTNNRGDHCIGKLMMASVIIISLAMASIVLWFFITHIV